MHVLLGHLAGARRGRVRGALRLLAARKHLRPRLLPDHKVDQRERVHVRIPLHRLHAQVH